MSPEEKRVFDALSRGERFNRLVAFDASYPHALVTQQKWAPDGVYGRALGVARNSVENNFLIEPQALVLKE